MVSQRLLGALILGALTSTTIAQAPVWGQCGGIGWSGPTSCVSGACCTVSNPYYSQCLPGTCGGGGTTGTSTTPTTTLTATPTVTPPPSPSGNGTAGCGKTGLTSGTYSVTVNGQSRQYILKVPDNYDPNKPYRFIFGIHWLGGTMGDVANGGLIQPFYGLQSLAANSAIFVAPQGLNNAWPNDNGQDTAVMDAIIQTIDNGLCVNPRLRFSTGFSYGAAMSYSLACNRANIFRAVAALSGGPISGCEGGSNPIAYLGIHGTHDQALDFSFGRDMKDRFVRNNGCTAQNAPEPSNGSGAHIKTEYAGCSAGYPVTWIPFDGDHTPIPPGDFAPARLGLSSRSSHNSPASCLPYLICFHCYRSILIPFVNLLFIHTFR
ncbi:hypothetical protein VNI00_012112 [Paramarasmius palmivorus]|uniref:Feruloyl esterase C n=1 Tax=Paramarasmius palmivorus TaxID=297713 RepID=A0AAW0CA73_9AGAR